MEDHWERYEGDFKEDLKEGNGILYLVNGEKFVGEFKADMVNGNGTYHKLNGEVIKGYWNNNSKIR